MADVPSNVDPATKSFLGKEMYLVVTRPVRSPEIAKRLGDHLAHQIELEKRGIMFAAGPLYPRGSETPEAGMFVLRASSFEEAEARKKAGDLPENYRADLLGPYLENAALEVTRAIQFFYTSTPYTRIDQILLAGGSAQLPGLSDIIAGRTRIATSVVAPFQGMQMGAGVREQQLRNDAPGYLVACGLALRRFG